MGVEQLLIPGKFIALSFHLVAVTMIFFTYVSSAAMQPDNIKVSLPNITSRSDAQFLSAKLNVLFACALTVVLLAI